MSGWEWTPTDMSDVPPLAKGGGTMPPTLTEFLLARLAEDEAVARAAQADAWSEKAGIHGFEDPWPSHLAFAEHLTPARVLADVEAKRAIVELHDPGQHSELCATCSEGGPGYDNSPLWFPCPTIRILATIYADHPSYDESWRP